MIRCGDHIPMGESEKAWARQVDREIMAGWPESFSTTITYKNQFEPYIIDVRVDGCGDHQTVSICQFEGQSDAHKQKQIERAKRMAGNAILERLKNTP